MAHTQTNPTTIVCYGEVLWDIFPHARKAGGAPFNVAYNLKQMGVDAHMISRVGKDELGDALLKKIDSWNIPINDIQVDDTLATSTVVAHIDEHNEAHYDIINNVAWDNIQYRQEDAELLSKSSAFVFGSLVTRNETSKNTLHQLIEAAPFRVFDINLRPPFIDLKRLQELLHKANLVKMNKAELRELLAEGGKNYISEEDSMRYLQEKYSLDEILVTKGSKGAVYLNKDTFYRSTAIKVEVVDTVGSGDSFLAGFLSGKFLGLNEENKPLSNACALGAFITNHEGACPDYTMEEFNQFKQEQPTPETTNYSALINQ
jgi:fructokinase